MSGSRLSACAACDRIHVAADVVLTSRFGGAPLQHPYLAVDGTLHATRELAQEWLCLERQRRRNADRSP